MGLTPEKQLEQFGLTHEQGQELLRLTGILKKNYEVAAVNSEVAQRSFGEWLSDVLPSVGKALGMAATIISKLLRSVATLVYAFRN
jgi:hypothetical protein